MKHFMMLSFVSDDIKIYLSEVITAISGCTLYSSESVSVLARLDLIRAEHLLVSVNTWPT